MDEQIPEVARDEFEEIQSIVNDPARCRIRLKAFFGRFALKTREFNIEFNRIQALPTKAEIQAALPMYKTLYERFTKRWYDYLELKNVLQINDKNHCETLKEEEKLAKIIENLDGKNIKMDKLKK